MSSASIFLSVCSRCSGYQAEMADERSAAAECLSCGCFFLLPTNRFPSGSIPASIPDVCTEHSCPAAVANPLRHRWATSTLISLLLNAAVLFVLAGFWIGRQHTRKPLRIESAIATASEPLPEFEAVVDLGGGNLTDSLATPRELLKDVISYDVTEAQQAAFALPSGVGGVGASGSGPGMGRGAGIFPDVGDAGSFAYVVDASGSMNGARMGLVLQELARSMNGLADGQSFFVVFFSDRTFPMMWPNSECRLLAATRINRQRILNWAFTVQPDGGTEPRGALLQALKLKPDVLYFLTDGEVPSSTVRTVKQNRHDTTSIHTICVGNDSSREIMTEIASVGGGDFVNVR